MGLRTRSKRTGSGSCAGRKRRIRRQSRLTGGRIVTHKLTPRRVPPVKSRPGAPESPPASRVPQRSPKCRNKARQWLKTKGNFQKQTGNKAEPRRLASWKDRGKEAFRREEKRNQKAKSKNEKSKIRRVTRREGSCAWLAKKRRKIKRQRARPEWSEGAKGKSEGA